MTIKTKTTINKNYTRGIILGFRRSLRHQNFGQVRIKIENVKSLRRSSFFLGKRVFLIEKNSKRKRKNVMEGKITSLHGRSGVFIARFKNNLSPSSISNSVGVTLFPNNNNNRKLF